MSFLEHADPDRDERARTEGPPTEERYLTDQECADGLTHLARLREQLDRLREQRRGPR